MKWLFTSLAVAAFCLLTAPACGGRAHLSPHSGKYFKRLFKAQVDSRPRKPLGKLSAQDAKLIMQNHNTTYGGVSKRISRGGSKGGSIQPVTLDLGGGSGGGGGDGIRLRAR